MALVAYFLTWTTYGTRVHGDGRGSIDDGHNTPGTPPLPADPSRHARVAATMAEAPFVMDAPMRDAVESAMRDHATFRRWRIDALNVRTNHVHVVVAAVGYKPEIVVAQLKSWSTRRLREAGLIGDRCRVWTKMASTRYINSEESRVAAVDYVRNHQ
ncbi:MAG: transposase [Planctomycetota bacterium]